MTLRTHRILAIASVVVGVLAYRSLASWNPDPHGQVNFEDWLFSSVDAIPQIYYALAAALVYRNRKSFRSAMEGVGSPALALLPLAVGSVLFAWGHYVAATDLLLVSFVLVSMGVALLWFGAGFAATWAIPCVILLFAFPIPAALTNQVFYSLRLWTADHVVELFTLIGFPVYHEGNVIYGADVVAQVIDSCSGLRAMEMLTLATFLFVQWSPADRLRGVVADRIGAADRLRVQPPAGVSHHSRSDLRTLRDPYRAGLARVLRGARGRGTRRSTVGPSALGAITRRFRLFTGARTHAAVGWRSGVGEFEGGCAVGRARRAAGDATWHIRLDAPMEPARD